MSYKQRVEAELGAMICALGFALIIGLGFAFAVVLIGKWILFSCVVS